MSEASETPWGANLPALAASPRRDRRDSLQARADLVVEVVKGGFLEL
ncbi:MAG: hypothetical protein HY900_21110, partial [Deltaproteobacteria bacterium]|nr:hypothetical protein [Deltaproteobacteria bacterium]